MRVRISALTFFLAIPCAAFSADATIVKNLTDALTCKGDPAQAVYSLVDSGSKFDKGFAAYGFGEGTSYRAVVILDSSIRIAGSETMAVISETENSHADFGGFTYARFKGDFRTVVNALKLQPEKAGAEFTLGKFVSRPASTTQCPPTIVLTPTENGEFLLGCGWCNG